MKKINPDDRLTFDARTFAIAWNAVGIAALDDPDRPALHRAHRVEWGGKTTGVRITATDGFLVAQAWIPTEDAKSAIEPAAFRVKQSFTAHDSLFRAKELAAHLIRRTGGKDAEPLRLTARVGPAHTDELRLEGTEGDALILDVPDQELHAIPVDEATFPGPEGVNGQSAAITEIMFGGPNMERLAKMAKLVEAPIRLSFGGHDEPAAFVLRNQVRIVHGYVMPARDSDRKS